MTPNALRRWLLEDRATHGLGGPPNNTRQATFRDEWDDRNVTVIFINDAHEVWIAERWGGEEERYVYSGSAQTFRQMALWYLWRWAWGEWFGLRRWLFYWDLKRKLGHDD